MAYTIFLQRLRYKLIKSRSKKLGMGHFFSRSFRYVSSLKGPIDTISDGNFIFNFYA